MCDGRVYQDMIDVVENRLVDEPDKALDYMFPIYLSKLIEEFSSDYCHKATLAYRAEELLFLIKLIIDRDYDDCHHNDFTSPCSEKINLINPQLPTLLAGIEKYIGSEAYNFTYYNHKCWCCAQISKYQYLSKVF